MESLIFLVEKRDGRIKGRLCANGSVQRAWMSKEDSSSPTAYLESIMLTSAIDAKEEREVMTVDIQNAFIQTKMERKENDDKIIMKITGIMVNMLVQISPEVYGPKVVYQKGKKM